MIWSFIMQPGGTRGERGVETAKPDIYSVSDQGQMTTSEAVFLKSKLLENDKDLVI